jgi:hypothetical protein
LEQLSRPIHFTKFPKPLSDDRNLLPNSGLWSLADEATNGDKALAFTNNQSTYIPLALMDRFANPDVIHSGGRVTTYMRPCDYLRENNSLLFQDIHSCTK